MMVFLPVEQPRPTVQGIVIGSQEELRVAIALDKYNWTFEYQEPFFGGHTRSGGFVVDFIVHTVPLWTPLWVHGEYWHQGAQLERDKLNEVLLRSRLRGYGMGVTLWGKDLETQDEANQAILREFGRR